MSENFNTNNNLPQDTSAYQEEATALAGNLEQWATEALGKKESEEQTGHIIKKFRVFTLTELPGVTHLNPSANRSQCDVSDIPDAALVRLIEYGVIGSSKEFEDVLYGAFSSVVTDCAEKHNISTAPDLVPGFYDAQEESDPAHSTVSKRGTYSNTAPESDINHARGKHEFPAVNARVEESEHDAD